MAWIIRHGHGVGPHHPDLKTRSDKRTAMRAFQQAKVQNAPVQFEVNGKNLTLYPERPQIT